MNNTKNEPLAHSVQTASVQQSVEEAYLNSLLNSFSINEEHDVPALSESIHAKSVIISEPVPLPAAPNNATNNDDRENLKESSSSVSVTNVTEKSLQETWPQVPFACQLITVAGLKLALPVSSYTQIFPWPGELVPAKNNETPVAGHMQHGVCSFDIVDLTGLILNRSTTEATKNNQYSYSHVMLLQDGSTCLPCGDLLEMITVDPDKVCWRSSDSPRTWLAGTVKDEGFALLDSEKIMQLLGKY